MAHHGTRAVPRCSGPLLTGVIELIWNAIDADAGRIQVILRDNGLGGIGEVEVRDDGHGIDQQTAMEGFLSLGKSWKAQGGRSRTLGRALHGKEGRGRFRLFRHGGIACWESVAVDGGRREKVRIVIRHGDPDIEIERLGETEEPVGTRVVLSSFTEPPLGLTGGQAHDRLLSTFVLPIDQHSLQITYDGTLLDPGHVRESQAELEIAISPGGPLPITVVQWNRAIGHQDLYLCDAAGATLEKVPSRVPAPGIYFTAYLRWDGFSDQLANLAVTDLDSGPVAEVLAAGRRRLEQHFRDVLARRQRKVFTWRGLRARIRGACG